VISDRCSSGILILAFMCATLITSLAGCTGGSSGGGQTTATASVATNSSLIAIDCKRQRAYIPLEFLNNDGHGQVAVLDLSVDPDESDPLVGVIDIGLIALPRATAVDIESGTVLVLADPVITTGSLILINEDDLSITSVIPLPTGSRPSETSGVVVNPKNNTALVSMSDALDCANGVGGCTGAAVFDFATQEFGPFILTLVDLNGIGLDPRRNVALASSDPLFSILLAFDLNVPEQIPCELDDQNVKNLFADPDGIAVDPTTNIWVLGNFESATASIVNLNHSTFNGAGTQDCQVQEGGTPPNSINHDTGTGAEGMPGVAISPLTHKALMTADESNQISLLSLPAAPVKQLKDTKVSSVHSTIPNDPNGTLFDAATFPYGVAIDTCHNLGYVLGKFSPFLAQIDLATFHKNPDAIATALPAGTCAAAATSFRCDNGNGVKFYPVPSLSVSAANTPAQMLQSQLFGAPKRKTHRK